MTVPKALIWPTLLAIPAIAVLIGLGIWQLERRTWKHDLIARAGERPGMEAVALPEPGASALRDSTCIPMDPHVVRRPNAEAACWR